MLEKTKVHVLSDEPRVVYAARSLPPRFEVSFARNRVESFRLTGKVGAEVAVLELELGGYDIARDMRERASTKDVKIVMLVDRVADRWLSKQAGADEVIVKPLDDTTTLKNAIESVLSSKAANNTAL